MRFRAALSEMLAKIDSFFESKKESERTIIIFTPALLIIYLSYMYLYPMSEQLAEDIKSKIERNRNQIMIKGSRLQELQQTSSVNQIMQEIESIKEKTAEASRRQLMSKGVLQQIAASQQSWHEMLDFIADRAEVEGVKVARIDSQVIEKERFTLLVVLLEGSGSFDAFLNYLGSLEEYSGYLDIKSFNLQNDAGLEFGIMIEGWRVKF